MFNKRSLNIVLKKSSLSDGRHSPEVQLPEKFQIKNHSAKECFFT